MKSQVETKITLKCEYTGCDAQELFEEYLGGDEEDCWDKVRKSTWIGNRFDGFYCKDHWGHLLPPKRKLPQAKDLRGLFVRGSQ